MPCQPQALSAVHIPLASALLPGEVVSGAFNLEPSSIQIQPLPSQLQSFVAKRLDGSPPLSSARAQRRLQIWEIIQSNRLIVFCRNVRRPGEQRISTQSSNRPPGSLASTFWTPRPGVVYTLSGLNDGQAHAVGRGGRRCQRRA
jgi:hypothetical protein